MPPVVFKVGAVEESPADPTSENKFAVAVPILPVVDGVPPATVL